MVSGKHCVLEYNPSIFSTFYVEKKVAIPFTYCTLTHIPGYIEKYCYFCTDTETLVNLNMEGNE